MLHVLDTLQPMSTSRDDLKQIIEKYRNMEEGIFAPPSTGPSDPHHVALFGGVCGPPLSVTDFALCDGLAIRQTFAHVMAPYILAFAPPKKKGAPHPRRGNQPVAGLDSM